MQSKKPRSVARSVPAVFIIVLLALAITAHPAQAQTFKVLHTFKGREGYAPMGVLVRDRAGNIYGTTSAGGTGKCHCGTAFKLNKNGKQVWLHSFQGVNGYSPSAGMLRDTAGNLFGTTEEGGDTNCNSPYGCGTVFKLNDKTGKETMLHKFTGPPDGLLPEALLVEDATGNLYGPTYIGGNLGLGAVFKIDTAGQETVLYNFSGGSDGCFPYPGVTLDSAGNLYGVTAIGGSGFGNSGYGVVFKVDTAGNETVLHTFGGPDGANPDSVLLFDSQGNLYGTTEHGGNSQCGMGCGTVFKLSPDGSESVLYAFCSLSNCTDGKEPGTGPLVRDSAGNLYGTTYFGGTSGCNGAGCGVVFKLDPTGKETVLHSFTGGADGAFPYAGLVMDAARALYGTASGGGGTSCKPNGCGELFKITP
jgi:uncharacterized repeat protein (TIGR03803 family)